MKAYDFIKNLFTSDDVILKENVIDLLNSVSVSFETINNAVIRLKEDDKNIDNVFAVGGINGTTTRDSLNKIGDLCIKINSAKSIVMESMDGEFRFVKDGASAKQLGVIALAGDLATTMDVLRNLVLLSLYKLTGDDLYYATKASGMLSFITNNSHRVSNLLKNDPRKTAKKIATLSSNPISEGHKGADAKFIGDVTARFDGNPLYTIGKWWVGRQHERNERRKVEAKLISLKVMDLKSQQNGEDTSEAVKRQIEYLERRLSVLDKEIQDYEES